MNFKMCIRDSGCTVSNREHRYLGRTDEPLDEAGVFELENALNNGGFICRIMER